MQQQPSLMPHSRCKCDQPAYVFMVLLKRRWGGSTTIATYVPYTHVPLLQAHRTCLQSRPPRPLQLLPQLLLLLLELEDVAFCSFQLLG
jgi:hypothetical protein